MKFAKIFKIFKKGSKVAAKKKGKGAVSAFDWPSGVRVGVFGHANAGKTVYFTVLNEESKISKDLQLSVTDNQTAGEFLRHYRSIWGLGTTSDVGTVVDLAGDKKFPDPTQTDRVLQFNAILDRSKKLPVVTYDYPGNAISISDRTDLSDKVIDFMDGCQGILFFFDPKVMQADTRAQAHVASFVSMLERLAPVESRLPIPVGLVITKADILDGFSGDDQAVLIGADLEHALSDDYELFMEKVLATNKITSNPAWAGSVRTVLTKLRDFLNVVVGRTLDFQIFFTSSTGQAPEKVGSDVGRSIYKPPEKVTPVGAKEPLYWLLNSIQRNRGISRIRTISKYVALISIIWVVLFSAPFVFHFNYLLPKAENIEKNIMKAYDGNVINTDSNERSKIISAYSRYERAWTIKWLFPQFAAPTGRLRSYYEGFNMSSAVADLNQVIGRFTAVVQDSALWPKLNPSDATIIENEEHAKLVTDLSEFHQGNEGSELYKRSDRVLRYWELFKAYIANRSDTTTFASIAEQVEFDARTYGTEISKNEKDLGQALTGSLKARTEQKVQQVESQRAAADLGDLFERINGNDSPAYRLDEAVAELRRIKGRLDGNVDSKNIAAIDAYIRDANRFKERRKYTYKVESIPGNGHLHVEVVPSGQDPTWQEQSQTIQGFDYSLRWKVGDRIHIALDTAKAAENWGKTASDKKILSGKYSAFDMDGEISFENLGKKVTIRFNPPLAGRLPVLKK